LIHSFFYAGGSTIYGLTFAAPSMSTDDGLSWTEAQIKATVSCMMRTSDGRLFFAVSGPDALGESPMRFSDAFLR